MPHPQQQQIIDALWPPEIPPWMKVWAVLDGARDERIFTAVEGSPNEKSCLYAGKLPWALMRAAPYLVELNKGDRFTKFLIDEGWGNSWGIFMWSIAGLTTLRRHFRGFLRVKDEDGNNLIFRWYDPRVLRLYLPTCLPEELEMFYGPVAQIYLESTAKEPGLRLKVEGAKLLQEELTL